MIKICLLMYVCTCFTLLCASCASTPSVTLPASTRVIGSANVYLSVTGERLEVIHDPRAGVAIVKLPDGTVAILPEEIAATEGRYRDTRMTVWEHDGVVVLWVEGTVVFNGRIEQ